MQLTMYKQRLITKLAAYGEKEKKIIQNILYNNIQNIFELIKHNFQ